MLLCSVHLLLLLLLLFEEEDLSFEVHLLVCVAPAPHISFSSNNFHDLTIYLHKNRHPIEF